MIKIQRGLDVPITGVPDASRRETKLALSEVALVGEDYLGLRPTMLVREGDAVKLGQPLFEHKRNPRVQFTAPVAGEVVAVNRGEKRRFLSLVIAPRDGSEEEFTAYHDRNLLTLEREAVVEQLLKSGLWTALRSRPYSHIPDPDTQPRSLFVTAMDTHPLAADPAPLIAEFAQDFVFGLQALSRLTEGKLYLCQRAGASLLPEKLDFISLQEFEGPHPAGLPGTHIHFLDPVDANKAVWHIGYQDVIAVGKLFSTGRLWTQRVISVAGPAVKQPHLVTTRLGAKLDDLVEGELADDEVRLISGSVLCGRRSQALTNYLGRYHNQVSVLHEGRKREFLGWLAPGFSKFSVKKILASGFLGGGKRFPWTTSLQGSRRAIVPVGTYEQVVPLDLMPTHLLKSLIVGNLEQAQELGCLELDEEDLALCTFVCPGKYDYGTILRERLDEIEAEG